MGKINYPHTMVKKNAVRRTFRWERRSIVYKIRDGQTIIDLQFGQGKTKKDLSRAKEKEKETAIVRRPRDRMHLFAVETAER